MWNMFLEEKDTTNWIAAVEVAAMYFILINLEAPKKVLAETVKALQENKLLTSILVLLHLDCKLEYEKLKSVLNAFKWNHSTNNKF